ncbi:MAG: DNA recombination protein RmuC, partial [Alistipes sp.]|nr:DNA recombination protein RmuC [Alistipes sp.]
MDTMVIIILICAAVTAAALALITLLMNRERARLITEKNEMEQRLTAEKNDISQRAASERAALESRHASERTALEEQLRDKMVEVATLRTRVEQTEAEREKMEEQFKAQFRNLANDILGEQSRQFRQTNKDEIDKLLKPFRDNITDFRERVERIYSSENEQRGALRNELENLMKLNARITTETANLTQALKGNSKVQGDWGEMILDSILDNSNLIRGIHYDTQLNIKDAEGNNLRPDVVLYLPEGKQIVIDSKVSLTAYADYTAAEDATERQRLLTAHIASVRQHVKELGSKEYQRLLQSPDFVIMFVPNEPAFLTALQSDN